MDDPAIYRWEFLNPNALTWTGVRKSLKDLLADIGKGPWHWAFLLPLIPLVLAGLLLLPTLICLSALMLACLLVGVAGQIIAGAGGLVGLNIPAWGLALVLLPPLALMALAHPYLWILEAALKSRQQKVRDSDKLLGLLLHELWVPSLRPGLSGTPLLLGCPLAQAWLPRFDGFLLDSGHSVAWEWPAMDGTPWKNAFFLGPLVRSHRELRFEVEGDQASLLWHIPISDEERAYKLEHGADALIERMDAVGLPWVFDEGNRPRLLKESAEDNF